jgi:ABC-2 type transport system ATP-binding protein
MTAFGVDNLVVRYSGITAVDDVTFAVAPGEVFALVGGDGAGKTSILRALAGAIASEEGRVSRPLSHQIGYVPTNTGIYHDLTTHENLSFSAAAYGVRGIRATERIEELLVATGLTDARDRLAGKLSGGMRQKLALATAFVHEPQLLVLDEPTTGVDPISRGELWRGIARAAAQGTAVVFSTTYLDEAERATYVIALDEGRVLVEGAPADLVTSIRGRVAEVADRPEGRFTYRRGARFRVWDPEKSLERDGIREDLQDVVTIAALRSRNERRAA